MTLESRFLSLLPVALLFVLARSIGRRHADWLMPSALFSLYWGATLLGALVLAPRFTFWPPAAWYVLVCAWLFHAGVVFGVGPRRPRGGARRAGLRPGVAATVSGRWVVLLTAASGAASALVMAAAVHGVTAADVTVEGVLAVGAEYASRRYSSGQGLPLLANLLNVPFYAGQAYAGAWAAGRPGRSAAKWVLLPISVGLLQAFLSNSRMPFVWMMTFMLGG